MSEQSQAIAIPKESEAEILYRRLETGYRRIEEAKAAGLDTTGLEEFFVVLLRKYDAACVQLGEKTS